jgi:hypothetical protein
MGDSCEKVSAAAGDGETRLPPRLGGVEAAAETGGVAPHTREDFNRAFDATVAVAPATREDFIKAFDACVHEVERIVTRLHETRWSCVPNRELAVGGLFVRFKAMAGLTDTEFVQFVGAVYGAAVEHPQSPRISIGRALERHRAAAIAAYDATRTFAGGVLMAPSESPPSDEVDIDWGDSR